MPMIGEPAPAFEAATTQGAIKLVGGKGEGLLMLDKELPARVFTPPAVSKDT